MSRSRVFTPAPDAAPPPRTPAPPPRGSNQSLIMAIIIIVLVSGGFALWSLYGAPPAETAPVIAAPDGAWKERFTGDQTSPDVPTAEIDQALEGRSGAAKPSAAAKTSTEPDLVAPPVNAAPAATRAQSQAGAQYVVQIAALQSEAAANAAWTRLSGKDPALFASATKDIQRADLGAKGVYFRVRAGYFTDRTEASRFCERVKTSGQDCIVVVR